jgi:hypothetical protein
LFLGRFLARFGFWRRCCDKRAARPGNAGLQNARSDGHPNANPQAPRPTPPDDFGGGVAGCTVARVGVQSGFEAGGCVAVSFRFEAFTVEFTLRRKPGGRDRRAVPGSFSRPSRSCPLWSARAMG